MNSTWIAKTYEDEIRLNLDWPVAAFHARVVNDLKCKINVSMIYRALKILGKHEKEFGKLNSYANELKKVMPTSTIKLMTEAPDPRHLILAKKDGGLKDFMFA